MTELCRVRTEARKPFANWTEGKSDVPDAAGIYTIGMMSVFFMWELRPRSAACKSASIAMLVGAAVAISSASMYVID